MAEALEIKLSYIGRVVDIKSLKEYLVDLGFNILNCGQFEKKELGDSLLPHCFFSQYDQG